MKFIHKKEPINVKDSSFDTFDGVAFVYDLENSTVENVISLAIESSFDGAIHWFHPTIADEAMNYILSYLKDSKDDVEIDIDTESADFILYMKNSYGLFIVDAKVDFGSTISEIISKKFGTLDIDSYFCYYDSHLIDNLNFERQVEINGNDKLLFFFKAGLFNDSFLFNIIDSLDFEDTSFLEEPIAIAILSYSSIDDFIGINDCPLIKNCKIVNSNIVDHNYTGVDLILYSKDIKKDELKKLESLNIKMLSFLSFLEYLKEKYFN